MAATIVKSPSIVSTASLPACCLAGLWLILAAPPTAAVDAAAATDHAPSLSTRIVGGAETQPGDWPAVLSVVSTFAIPATFDRHFCGATLVAPGWALTAAHCLFQGTGRRALRPDEVRVVGGLTNLSEATTDDEIAATNLYVHPGYDNDFVSSPDDIGLIELATDIDVPIVSLYSGSTSSLIGTGGNIIGWGALSVDGGREEFSPRQQTAQVPVVATEVCNAMESYDGLVGERQLCAGLAEGGIDACAGDSGGPLIIDIRGDQVQAGVVSFGNGCAEPGFYGIYTHVSAYEDWISQYVTVRFRSPEETPDGATSSGDGGATDAGSGGGDGAETGGNGGIDGGDGAGSGDDAGAADGQPDQDGGGTDENAGGGVAGWMLLVISLAMWLLRRSMRV